MSEICSSVGGSPPGKSTSGFSMLIFYVSLIRYRCSRKAMLPALPRGYPDLRARRMRGGSGGVHASQADPFGTAELRSTVLAAWTASPARFREDANAEEDYALGGYRDRVIVELA